MNKRGSLENINEREKGINLVNQKHDINEFKNKKM